MTEFSYVTVDVFAERRFGGNQLAVVTDARGLDSETMQAIAAEFAYAETTFVLPPKDRAHTANVRIFTPRRELPFAGHPNVGTAFALGCSGIAFGRPVGGSLTFEEQGGLVSVELTMEHNRPTGAMLTAPQAMTILGESTTACVAACAGIVPEDVVTDRHRPIVVSVGMPFVFAELRDVAAVGRCTPDLGQFRTYFPVQGAEGLHVYARTGPQSVHCRMFAPLLGVNEDAATGSANVALTALFAALAPGGDARVALEIRQGVEMGRPSLLQGTAEKVGGRVTEARIGGGCVAVMEGRIRLD